LKPGYGHVSLVIRQGGFYIWIEPTIGFTEVKLLPITVNLFEIFPENTEIIPFVRWRTIEKHRIKHLFAVFSCVEQVKAYLGIKNALLFTPWQLAHYLIKEDSRNE
jgi:hypothetical protein